MESVLHGRCGFPWRVLQQPQAMLELRDAELDSTVGELGGECVRALRRQRGRAYRGEGDALEELPGRAVAIWLGHEDELGGADVGARASTRRSQPFWQESERVL